MRLPNRWTGLPIRLVAEILPPLDRRHVPIQTRTRLRNQIVGMPNVRLELHAGSPLTITDFASRYLLACEALSTTKERYAFGVFE